MVFNQYEFSDHVSPDGLMVITKDNELENGRYRKGLIASYMCASYNIKQF